MESNLFHRKPVYVFSIFYLALRPMHRPSYETMVNKPLKHTSHI